ncbi:sulfotransferase 1 family member D1-like [Eupeodes corollae]|uniref:sulfotransferase 1 family member D1-like n=1 Tax=Eupeodes corollae TaxID=290404 RepID=UPI0024937F48|nr:sulfotransferase 1 family member D1-like [Eupeodes corollae]
MFQIKELHNSAADNLKNKEGIGLINLYPLDKIPVTIPKSWTFKPTCMPVHYQIRAEDYANFEVREDDIWIITYPKCGTTWTQEMTWMLMNDLNFDKSNSIDLLQRSIFFEMEGLVPIDTWKNIELLNNQESPRVIKSHLPIGLLPRDIWRKKCKIIYVTRDPKDMIVSFYHQFNGILPCNTTIDEFVECILTDNMMYCSYWNHVLEFWLIREQSNILFFTYEDMKKDLKAIIGKTSKFLKKDYTEEQINLLMKHLSFENMKASSTCNNQDHIRVLHAAYKVDYDEKKAFKFMRKGLVGEYKKELSQDCIERINAKTKESFEPYGLDLYCG